MFEDLQIVLYPDPRLRKMSRPVDAFDENLAALAERMFEMMRENKGVGLAAPQVGQNIRLFVINHSGQPQDDRVYVNPVLSDADGDESDEEGCLSIPDIRADISRNKAMRIDAQDLRGTRFSQTETGYIARIWQHEFDHLNGILITDRMGAVAKMSHRKKLREMEEKYAVAHPTPAVTRTPLRRTRKPSQRK